IRSAYLLRAHAAIVPVTWSPAVIRSLMWTPSTFMQSTRVMPGTRSGSLTDDLRAFRTNIISNNFERLSLRLFARAQSAMWLSSSSTVSDVTGGHWISVHVRAPCQFLTQLFGTKTAMIQQAEPNPTQGAMDLGSHLIDSPDKQGQHFLALGPALRILQLNVEGMSAAKRELISDIAARQKVDVVCLQETHVNDDKADRLNIQGFDIVNYALHSKHGRATYVRSDITEPAHVVSTRHCDVVRVGGFHIANVYKPPSETWKCPTPFPVLPHPNVLIGDFNSHHPDWGYSEPDSDGDQLQNWASCND